MGVPNYLEHVRLARDRWPAQWRQAHTGGPQTEDFIKLLASYLHYEVDERVGLNGKRGNPDDLSDDVVCYRAPGQSRDVRTGESVSVMDVIGSAGWIPGEPEPYPAWGEVWDTRLSGPTPATWVKPARIHDTAQTPAPPAAGWNPATHGVLLARLAAAGITDTQRIAEQFAFSFPAEGWGQKRAADNRPISNNVIARQEPFVGYQVVPASMNPTTFDLRGQVFVPVLPVNHVFEAPAPSPEPPPPPPPTPTPPPAADLAAVLAELKALREEVNALVAREFPEYEGTVDAFGNALPITLKVKR